MIDDLPYPILPVMDMI